MSGHAAAVAASASSLLTTDQAFWHCLSLVLGLGTLTVPYTFKGLGWAAGVVFLAIIAGLSNYTAKLLCHCVDYTSAAPAAAASVNLANVNNMRVVIRSGSSQNGGEDEDEKEDPDLHKSKRSRHQLNSYPDIGEAAFGYYGKGFVSVILYVDLVASSALFLVFIATNLHTLFPSIMSRTQWILFISLTLLPTVWLKLQKLSWLSTLGAYLMLALVVTVVYAAFSATRESFDEHEYHVARMEFSTFGNIVFAFSAHGTLITIYKSMSKPSEVGRLFDRIYLTGFCVKCIVGLSGYYLFAQHTKDQITLNLPIPWLRNAITLALSLKNWLTYALPLEPVAVDCEHLWAPKSSGGARGFRVILIRSLLVGLTTILALWLPYFGLFQSLIGSLCAGFLVLVFPEAFYLKLYGKHLSRPRYWLHVTLLLLFLILVILAVTGTLEEAQDLVDTLKLPPIQGDNLAMF